jgi:hypothetical protein
VRERRGPIGRATGLAEGVANAMRRMARDREPRVLVFDSDGYARLVQPDARGHDRVLEVAEQLVELVDAAEPPGRRAGGEAA